MTAASYPVIIGNPPFQSRLPQHPAIKGHESILGYALRLAEANGYDSPQWLSRLQRAHQQNITSQLLSFATGYDRAIFSNREYRFFPGNKQRRLLLGDWIPGQLLRAKRPHFCPICLKEEGYFHISWDIAVTACCPKHGVLLHDRCHSCGEHLDWNRRKLLRCDHCETPYCEAPAEKADPRALTLIKFLLNKEKLSDVDHRAVSHLPQALRLASFGETLSTILFLMSSIPRNTFKAGHKGYRTHRPADIQTLLIEVSDLLDDWPSGFHRFLDTKSMLSHRCRVGKGISNSDFRDFYLRLFQVHRENSLTFLREEFSQYVNKKWSGSSLYAGSMIIRSIKAPRFVTATKACEILGVSYDTLRSLRQRGEIGGPSSQATITDGNLYDRQALLDYSRRAEDGIYLHEILSLFDTEYSVFQRFVRAGLIKQRRAVRLNKTLVPGYARSDVVNLLGKLLGSAPSISNPEPGQLHWSKAIVFLRRSGIDSGKLAKLILLKRISVIGIDPQQKGLEQILLDGVALEDLRAKIKSDDISFSHKSRPLLERALCVSS
ncbi:TniQ family protein [Ferrovibrio sp.]|uniref:TniQ family protein n=1 Tax=Ferrovibrio sp. TaxID=1917215 RepID=UPI003D0A30D4